MRHLDANFLRASPTGTSRSIAPRNPVVAGGTRRRSVECLRDSRVVDAVAQIANDSGYHGLCSLGPWRRFEVAPGGESPWPWNGLMSVNADNLSERSMEQ